MPRVLKGDGFYIYLFLLLPLYIWFSFHGVLPYIYTSVLLAVPFSLVAGLSILSLGRANWSVGINKFASINLLLVCGLISIIAAIILLNYLLGDNVDSSGRSLFATNFGLLINYIFWFGWGFFLFYNFLTGEGGADSVVLGVWGALSLFYLVNVDLEAMSLSFVSEVSDKKSMYLMFSDFYAIAAFFALSRARNLLGFCMILTLTTCVIFFLQSRATLVFFMGVVAFSVLLGKSAKAKILLCVFGICLGALIPVLSSIDDPSLRRMTIFFGSDFQHDGSLSGRNLLLATGLETISTSPVWGSYNSLVTVSSNVTAYIHNILSFWQLYGLIAFALSVYFFIILPSVYVAKFYASRELFSLNPNTKVVAYLSIFVVFQVILARSYVWHFAWLYLGMLLAYFTCLKTNKH